MTGVSTSGAVSPTRLDFAAARPAPPGLRLRLGLHLRGFRAARARTCWVSGTRARRRRGQRQPPPPPHRASRLCLRPRGSGSGSGGGGDSRARSSGSVDCPARRGRLRTKGSGRTGRETLWGPIAMPCTCCRAIELLEPDSLSSALAFPLDLGARPLCRRLRGRGCGNCQSLPQAELFVRQRERPRGSSRISS